MKAEIAIATERATAKPAAIASKCVYRQQAPAFWEFHDWAFAHQAEITPENLKDKVLEWAKPAIGADKGGHRAEFVRLVEKAKGIGQKKAE